MGPMIEQFPVCCEFNDDISKMKTCGYPSELIELPLNKWSAGENILDFEFNFTNEGTYYIEYS